MFKMIKNIIGFGNDKKSCNNSIQNIMKAIIPELKKFDRDDIHDVQHQFVTDFFASFVQKITEEGHKIFI